MDDLLTRLNYSANALDQTAGQLESTVQLAVAKYRAALEAYRNSQQALNDAQSQYDASVQRWGRPLEDDIVRVQAAERRIKRARETLSHEFGELQDELMNLPGPGSQPPPPPRHPMSQTQVIPETQQPGLSLLNPEANPPGLALVAAPAAAPPGLGRVGGVVLLADNDRFYPVSENDDVLLQQGKVGVVTCKGAFYNAILHFRGRQEVTKMTLWARNTDSQARRECDEENDVHSPATRVVDLAAVVVQAGVQFNLDYNETTRQIINRYQPLTNGAQVSYMHLSGLWYEVATERGDFSQEPADPCIDLVVVVERPAADGEYGVRGGFKPGKQSQSPPGSRITARTLYRYMSMVRKKFFPDNTSGTFRPTDPDFIPFHYNGRGSVTTNGFSPKELSHARFLYTGPPGNVVQDAWNKPFTHAIAMRMMNDATTSTAKTKSNLQRSNKKMKQIRKRIVRSTKLLRSV